MATADPPTPETDALVPLGRVTKPHGLRGDVRVQLYNRDSALLEDLEEVLLGEPPAPRRIESARRHGELWRVRFAGVDGRDAAEALRGAELRIPRADLPEPEEGEYYHVDLLGLRAVDADDGEERGEVVEVLAYPSVDCLLLRRGEQEREVPLLEPYVVEVDLEAETIAVRHIDDFEPRPVRR
jgi:16S rRNA processing protein RimM